MVSPIKRLAHSPTLHFIVLGLIAFAAFKDYFAAPQVLVLDPEVVQQTISDWEQLQQSPITSEQRRRLGEQLERSAMLVKIAHDAGLDRTAAVEQRLLNLARFLDLVDASATDAAAIEAARELDLHHTDQVVRRYLETAAEFLLAEEAGKTVATDAEIAAYYRLHADDFRQPRQIRFSHIFIGGSDASAAARAQRVRHEVERRQLAVSDAIGLGDVFYGGHQVDFRTRRQLAALLGSEFAAAVWSLPVGEWSAPVASAYGTHVVRVEAERPALTPSLEAVQGRIVTRLEQLQRQRSIERRLAEMRERYHIVGIAKLENNT